MEFNMYDEFKRYAVQADNVEDFLNRYSKPEFFQEKDEQIKKRMIQIENACMNKFGFCMISQFDSITGKTVAFYKTDNQ